MADGQHNSYDNLDVQTTFGTSAFPAPRRGPIFRMFEFSGRSFLTSSLCKWLQMRLVLNNEQLAQPLHSDWQGSLTTPNL